MVRESVHHDDCTRFPMGSYMFVLWHCIAGIFQFSHRIEYKLKSTENKIALIISFKVVLFLNLAVSR